MVKRLLRNSAARVFRSLLLATTELRCEMMRDYLTKTGWFRSVEEMLPVDRDGNALPWFTYPAIYFLADRVRPEMAVFEYGSGNSTFWWAARVQRVVSCEHDRQWHAKQKDRVPGNVEYLQRDRDADPPYCETGFAYPASFDVVVIDGRDRVRCVDSAVASLKPDGVIVWDNSDREKYQAGYDRLTSQGFRRLDFEGHGPMNTYSWKTSMFYRPENCLQL